MRVPVFIGDEVTAAAWRLIGVRAVAVGTGNVAEVFETEIGDTELLLITAACAQELENGRLDAAVRRAKPLILLVPDAAERVETPDLDKEVDRVLGIEQ